MKRTPFKRKTPLKSKTGFKIRGGKLNTVSKSATSKLKESIQVVLRKIVIKRDGGCVLRHYPQTGQCGGYRKDGALILQAEHLHTRSNAASFADERLVVCLCMRHHLFYKPQYSDEYYRIIKQHIGEERTRLLENVQKDMIPHKVHFVMELERLNRHLHEMCSFPQLHI